MEGTVGSCCSSFVGDDTGVRLGVEVVSSPSSPGAGSPWASKEDVTSSSSPVADCSSIASLLGEDLGVPRRLGG